MAPFVLPRITGKRSDFLVLLPCVSLELSFYSRKNIEDISSTELASYVNAFLVTCVNPRNFFVLDLVRELRKRVDAQNHTLPYVMLALCNAGERMVERDVEKLTNFFWTAHRKFWIDMQALSILALACAARQSDGNTDLVELAELTVKLKAGQYSNGTYETLKTTALVMQALIATQSDTDEDNFNVTQALRQILLAQRDDGSFGSVIDTYSILPMLDYKSLSDINSSHCPNVSIEDRKNFVTVAKGATPQVTAKNSRQRRLVGSVTGKVNGATRTAPLIPIMGRRDPPRL
ncbi:hypothetical protein AVEN_56774-1 [Araneus ventricosus]|uniref:Uncharacterized protein n=1 Tax=Araneus ventricosus TaxID=182803 RepID=A0A4Y2H7P8_ARAVE|nr:hypothetical protein AVEN_56774-1 [Araneus ventricosus]